MNLKTTNYPNLPYVTGNNKTRVFTKHWANLPLHLNRNEMALLSFLTFQAKADNTFRYSLMLFTKYKKAIEYANEEYGGGNKRQRLPNDLTVTSGFIKFWFERLVERGWIIGIGGKNYMVNPMLTYVEKYMNVGEYREMAIMYKKHPADVAEYFKERVEAKVKSKKKLSKNVHLYWPE